MIQVSAFSILPSSKLVIINLHFFINHRRAYKKQGYRSEWQNRFPWATKARNGATMCTACNSVVVNNKTHLQRHDKTKKHKKNMTSVAGVQPLTDVITKHNDAVMLERKIVMHLVEHNIAFCHVNHLTKLIKECAKYPEAVQNVRCNRTKNQRPSCAKVSGPNRRTNCRRFYASNISP